MFTLSILLVTILTIMVLDQAFKLRNLRQRLKLATNSNLRSQIYNLKCMELTHRNKQLEERNELLMSGVYWF